MKSKVLKMFIAIVLLITLTSTNFLFVGASLISYAADTVTTNHENVEFEAYFKDENGKETMTQEKTLNQEEMFLYLRVNVKKEGYFNGEVSLEDSNFTLKETESSYVNHIEDNTIYLNQINVGNSEEIKIKIEPIKPQSEIKQNFDIDLLNKESKINLKGIYRDSTEKDIEIKANRELTLSYIENNTVDSLDNDIKVITNAVINIEGKEKRVLQFYYSMGLKESNYPMKQITAKINIPEIDGNKAQAIANASCNNMTNFEYEYEDNCINLKLTNEKTENNQVRWTTQSNEDVLITCIYDEEVNLENAKINAQQKVLLYDDKEIENQKEITVGAEQVDSTVDINSSNLEEVIYKGKINAGIDRDYSTTTKLQINNKEAVEKVTVKEENLSQVNIFYKQTSVSKEQFNEILGENGEILIYDQSNNLLGTINKDNTILTYGEKQVTNITIETSKPQSDGLLEITHVKTIKSNEQQIANVSELKTKITANYNENTINKQIETTIKLENATTEAQLELDKENMSTVISNNVGMKVVLLSNNEKYELYKNPTIDITLPEQVENITINGVELLYEDELKIKNYTLNGKTISIALEGQQTQYKETVVEGATIIIDTTIDVNKKAAAKQENILMTVQNANGQVGNNTKNIEIVTPKDVTAVQSIEGIGIETIGQEESKQVSIPRGQAQKQLETQIEMINNNQVPVENVRIMGEFPTNNETNNMGIQIESFENLEGVENTQIYYSENENATADIENAENGWQQQLQDNNQAKKYLMIIPQMEAQSSAKATYQFEIPANLEYNQVAKTGYKIQYINSDTKVENEVSSTNIEMETGIGPNIETKLTATVGGKDINGTVKNGEVIHYDIQISNTGSEDITDITITGKVPEGTTLVVPEEQYEYSGASYYEELQNTTYEGKIESLRVGEVINEGYDVRVNRETPEGTTINNTTQVKYNDVIKENQSAIQTEKGDLQVTLKQITDRNTVNANEYIEYYVIVENISNQKQENIVIKNNISNALEVEQVISMSQVGRLKSNEQETDESNQGAFEYTDLAEETDKTLEYKNEMNIGSIEPGKMKVLWYTVKVAEEPKDTNEVNFSTVAKVGQKEYSSNEWTNFIEKVDVDITMTSNPEGQYIKEGDTLQYIITLENKVTTNSVDVVVQDSIPNQLTITKITKNGEDVEYLENSNEVIESVYLEPNGKATIVIETVVDYSFARSEAEAITNIAEAKFGIETIATTQGITHIIQANEPQEIVDDDDEIVDDEQNGNDEPSHEDDDPTDDTQDTKIISGIAWNDENGNGQKDAEEKLLNNIKVKLYDFENNKFVKETTTNENGVYLFDKVKQGQYIIIFEYDKLAYGLTKYKVEGVPEEKNSDVIENELQIENERKTVASTDIINIKENNISGINIGLIQLKNFDLSLNKYVKRILIQNSNGTTIREYDKNSIAKIELDAKQFVGSTVIIEYNIEVANQGEVDGYIRKIADYAPADLKFSSELNKDWYQVNNALYTNALANEKLKAGESKTITLALVKTMTQDNGGMIANEAEIVEDYNELGIADSNSTPGNREKTENDYGLAEAIISIRTGGVVYISLAIITTLVLGVIAVIIIKRRKNSTERRDEFDV